LRYRFLYPLQRFQPCCKSDPGGGGDGKADGGSEGHGGSEGCNGGKGDVSEEAAGKVKVAKPAKRVMMAKAAMAVRVKIMATAWAMRVEKAKTLEACREEEKGVDHSSLCPLLLRRSSSQYGLTAFLACCACVEAYIREEGIGGGDIVDGGDVQDGGDDDIEQGGQQSTVFLIAVYYLSFLVYSTSTAVLPLWVMTCSASQVNLVLLSVPDSLTHFLMPSCFVPVSYSC
jgi:hypothetical protein